MMNLHGCIVICSWAAILAWIRCGALALVVRTPPSLTSTHRVTSQAAKSHTYYPRLGGSVTQMSWFHTEDDVGVVTNWDSDQDEVELAQRMVKSNIETNGDPAYKYSTSSSSDEEKVKQMKKATTLGRVRDREKAHRRRRGFGMPTGSGATSDGVRFSLPSMHDNNTTSQPESSVLKRKNPTKMHRQLSSRWYVTLDKSTGLQVPLNMSIATKQPVDKMMESRAKAEATFRIKPSLLLDDEENEKKPTKRQRHEKRVKQLASLLSVPISSARTMIRRAPSLAHMDIAGTLRKRCIEMSLLLQCTPSRFASVIRRCPSLLTFRVETISSKLIQLDRLLSGQSVDDESNVSVRALSENSDLISWIILVSLPYENETSWKDARLLNIDVSDSTVSIARRVPQLLASNVEDTLSERSMHLRSLLFDEPVKDTSGGHEIDQAFARVLKRCPELLLYNIKETIEPKLSQLNSLFAHSCETLGTAVVLREPRLLLYDVTKSLFPKVEIWKARVEDESSFIDHLARYPTLLMYSFGAAARLEYFLYRNKRQPDASEARQLLMLSKKAIEMWGQEQVGCLFDSTPAILGGTISKRGRPRKGESALEACKRRDRRRAAQSCLPNQLEELKVAELRKLLKEYGGIPASKLKSQLISELHELGYDRKKNEMRSIQTNDEHITRIRRSTASSAQPCLSYSQWMAMKLCTSYPQFWETCDNASTPYPNGAQTVGELEKLYGLALKRSVKTPRTNASTEMVEGVQP